MRKLPCGLLTFVALSAFAETKLTFNLEKQVNDGCTETQNLRLDVSDKDSSITKAVIETKGCFGLPEVMSFNIVAQPFIDKDNIRHYRADFNNEGWSLDIEDRRKSQTFYKYNAKSAIKIELMSQIGKKISSHSKVKKFCAKGATAAELLKNLSEAGGNKALVPSHYVLTPADISFSVKTTVPGTTKIGHFSACQYLKEENLEEVNNPQALVCFRRSIENQPIDKDYLKKLLISQHGFKIPILTYGRKSDGVFVNGRGYQLSCWIGREADAKDFEICGTEE